MLGHKKLYVVIVLVISLLLTAASFLNSNHVPSTYAQVVNSGLTGQYYDTMSFTNLKMTRIDSNINFNWGTGAPASNMGSNTFTVRWTGYIVPQYSQTYKFYARVDDGVRLWVNNVRIINRWSDQNSSEVTGSISLQAGVYYPITLEYYDDSGSANITLSWSSASRAKEVVPPSALFISKVTPTPTLSPAPTLSSTPSNTPAPSLVPSETPIPSPTAIVTPPVNDGTPVGINGQLHVCGTYLCNQYNQPIQLRGMSTHGIQWYGWGKCITNASLDSLKNDWGADIMRVSMYVQEDGYETNPTAFTTQADTIIDALIARGLYVLIDWHMLDPGDPMYNLERAKTYFTHMSQRYKDNPNVIYEIANEPSGVTWTTIKNYANLIIPYIRNNDPDGVVIVGTPDWSSFGVSGNGSAVNEIVANKPSFDNLMYTFHFYAASHGTEYYNVFNDASNKLPVFVTEWGTQKYTGDGANNFTMSQQYVTLMAQKKISWTSWNYSDDFRSGAAFVTGTCPNGPFTGSKLKAAGTWVQDKIKNPPDNFPTN